MENASLVDLNPFSEKKIRKALFGSFRDPTAIALVVSNILTIFFAITQNWSIMVVLWSYWLQSIIIGFFNFFKILSLKEFSVEGFTINNRKAEATAATKFFTAGFFAFHYGFFHLIYAFFLLSFSGGTASAENDLFLIVTTSAIFFANHLFSFVYYLRKPAKKQNIGTVMMFPYARIIPMHLTIIFGGMFLSFGAFGSGVLVLFMALKTFADLLMHVVEHFGQQDQAGSV